MTMKISNKHELILNFIDHFSRHGYLVKDCFTEESYYFAEILRSRFGRSVRIVYDAMSDYFAAEIDGKIYDITGDITNSKNTCNWHYWDKFVYEYPFVAKEITHDSIRRIPLGVRTCEFCQEAYEDEYGNIYCGKTDEFRDTYEVCNIPHE